MTASHKQCRLALAALLAMALPVHGAAQPWSADMGNGQYRNPILHADYADQDAIRVGDTFYMTASSFSNAPGLPLLRSTDMVNWELVGHALPRLVPEKVFAVPQPGKGVWAPCIRHHDGKFWIFYPDPDFGVYVITAENFTGPWSAPHLLLAGKGIIDPTPLWDDDGKAWLMHGWAMSRSGRNNILTLRSMAPDARRLLDDKGRDVIEGDRLAGYHTIEGPKLYKANGYYYVFAPAGGVEHGWQSVFRSRRIEGPYEDRIVLAQGLTTTNGPHQGAWVNGVDGKDWFFHFQDKGAYGRVVHLQPMQWRDGWPMVGINHGGINDAGSGVGEPVLTYPKPAGRDRGILVPPTSDEFTAPVLGLQWQWNANAEPGWAKLSARRGHLRLLGAATSRPASLRDLASVLTQKFPAPVFQTDTKVAISGQDGQQAGLIVLGQNYAWLGLEQRGKDARVVLASCIVAGPNPAAPCTERIEPLSGPVHGPVSLRAKVGEGGMVRFSYSPDGRSFIPAGQPFKAAAGRWVGAQIGVFNTTATPAGKAGKRTYADIDYFRVAPIENNNDGDSSAK